MSCDPSTYLSFYLLETFYLPILLIPARPRFRTAACHSFISLYYVSFLSAWSDSLRVEKHSASVYFFFVDLYISAVVCLYYLSLSLFGSGF